MTQRRGPEPVATCERTFARQSIGAGVECRQGFVVEVCRGVVVCRGELDACSATQLVSTLARLDAEPLMLDCAGVRFIDAAGVGALVSSRRRNGREIDVQIIDASRAVRRVLGLCGLGALFSLEADTDRCALP